MDKIYLQNVIKSNTYLSYVKYSSNSNKLVFNSIKHEIKILILTLYQGGRGGDIGFLKLFIKYLIYTQGFKNTNIKLLLHYDKISWAKQIKKEDYFNIDIVNLNGSIGYADENPFNVGFVTKKSDMSKRPAHEYNFDNDTQSIIEEYKYIILAPNFHRFTIAQLEHLTKNARKIISITEYDFITNYNDKKSSKSLTRRLKYYEEQKLPIIKTGFSADSIGIFSSELMLYKNIDKSKLRFNGIESKYNIFVCYQHIAKNSEQFVDPCNLGDILSLIDIIKKCKINDKPTLIFWPDTNEDIIKSGLYKAKLQIIQSQHIKCISNTQLNGIDDINTEFTHTQQNILIIMHGLNGNEFKYLNSVSKFSVATGDQSIAEILINGRVAIYNVSSWKSDILPGIVSSIDKCMEKNGVFLTALNPFYRWQYKCDNTHELRIEMLRTYLCNEENYVKLLEQAKIFGEYLYKEHSINNFSLRNYITEL